MRGMVKYSPPPRRRKMEKRNDYAEPRLPAPFSLEEEARLPPEVQVVRKSMRDELVKKWFEFNAKKKTDA